MGDILQPLFGTDTGKTSVSGARWFGVACLAGGLVAGSVTARKRQIKGEGPILGVLF